MNDLPPKESDSLYVGGRGASKNQFNWWKTSVIVLVCLSVVVCWKQADRNWVRSGETVEESKVTVRPASVRRKLAHRFASDPDSLSDEEYMEAAVAYEAMLKKQRESNVKKVYRNPVDPRDRWQRKVDHLRSSIEGVTEFPKGSIQWHLRNELEEALKEEPEL